MKLPALIKQITACAHCAEFLPLGPRPVVRLSETSRLLIVGQAPGTRVHETGIPFNDPSGDRLRMWLDVDKETFYDESKIAIVPMGFCYPGKGKSGDLPPRPECAALWRTQLYEHLKEVELTLLIGQYAQQYYLKDKAKKTLTDTVRAYNEYLPMGYFPLVHPSPRNVGWFKNNPWFEKEVIPILREQVHRIL
jgi:uracil-DNA glycosylase